MDAIVAVYEDWGIGAEGPNLWRSLRTGGTSGKNPKCLGHCGTENPGRFSGGRPLPNRVNLVLTWEI